MWIAVQREPVLYLPGEGKEWLIEAVKYDAIIMKDCRIFRPGKNMDVSNLKRGYRPHAWECPYRKR